MGATCCSGILTQYAPGTPLFKATVTPDPPNLARVRAGLQFSNPSVETDFLRHDDDEGRSAVRVTAIASTAGWLAIGPMMLGLYPSHLWVWALTVFGLVVPVNALQLWLTRPAGKPMGQWGGMWVLILSGWSLAINQLFLADEPWFFVCGAIISTLVGLGGLRLRWTVGVVAIVLHSLPFQAVLIYLAAAGTLTARIGGVQSFMVWLSLGLALLTTVLDERRRRASYTQLRTIATQRAEIDHQKARVDALLVNVMPASIADRLKADQTMISDRHHSVTVVFADIVGFTMLSEKLPPEQLVEMLNRVFTAFDALALKHGVEKIKTIGDAYMAVAGVPEPRDDHMQAAADFALDIVATIDEMALFSDPPIRIRIGLHTGEVVAGVIGTSRFAYDLWGDTVNTAARLESHGIPGEIQISSELAAHLKQAYDLADRGQIYLKGKGEVQTWLLKGRTKEDASANPGAGGAMNVESAPMAEAAAEE
jgi:class 3 adenylate cyclase